MGNFSCLLYMMKFIKFIYSHQISQQFGMPLYITVFSSHRVYTKTGL